MAIIPKPLFFNAVFNSIKLVSKQNRLHYISKVKDDEKFKQLKWFSLDLYHGKYKNKLEAGVLEPTVSKIKCIRFSTEAAITILRIDDMIKLAPE